MNKDKKKSKRYKMDWSELKEEAKKMGWKVEDVYFEHDGKEIHTEAISNGENIKSYKNS